MTFTLYVGDNCPKCRKPTMQAVVQLHPTNPDLALQSFECAECGPVKTKIISLTPKTDSRPDDRPAEGAIA
jgi:ssDNA-binding Zn-finger/Zn-ribbon topoisomerase 1